MVNLNLKKEINKVIVPYFLLGELMNKEKIEKLVKNLLPYIIIVILVVLVRSFIVTPAIVDGSSMLPNLQNNNVIILNKLDYKLNNIKRFDVVVIDYNGEKLIKRIIGLPGEHIEYKENNLYVNGFITNEIFDHKKTNDFKLEMLGYLTIPGDKYFVLGDNRLNSTDSRVIGLIDKKDILGSVSYRIFPITKISKVK